jgi:tetratricopeptide (TPR) repeat protein
LRIFLSFHSKDVELAAAVRDGLRRIAPAAQVFFSPVSLGAGFWQPGLAEEIAQADAFILLIGPTGVGPWQDVVYNEAFDRHVHEQERFPLVPVIAANAQAPGLPFLRRLNWVEAPVVTEDRTLHRLLAALKGESIATATPLWKLVNPYRGLEAMTEANADYFYGRGTETAAVLTALAEKRGRIPILIGGSGVGKSSVARAGVLSALKSMQWPGGEGDPARAWPAGLKNSRTWLSLVVRPGEAPLEALAAAFIRFWQLDERDPDHAGLPRKWAERLASGDNKLADLINTTQGELEKRAGEAPQRMLVYLDQGEELYTRAAPLQARRFTEILAEGLKDRRLSAFASLRADYFDKLQADEPLFACREHVDVPPLDRARLSEVVTAPARALEVSFEDDRIADRITDAAAAEQLPLLSYLLHDMWDGMVRRGDATLRLSAQAIDVGGVLKQSAEDFLAANPGDEPALRRLLTLKLASVPPDGEPVRRQATREDCSDAEWALASRLAEYPWRLVVMRERSADAAIVAEVAHEAFLRAWPRLSGWLRDERDFLVFKNEAERVARRWHEMGESDKALLTGLDLTRAEEWLPTRGQDLSGDVAAFVRRSIARDRAEKERQLAEAEKQLRFQRRVTFGAAAAALVMLVIGGFAWHQWTDAENQRIEAVRQRGIAEKNEAQANIERDNAGRSFKLAQKTAERVVFDIARGLRDVQGMQAETVRKILETARRTFEQLATSAPDDLALQQSRAAMLREFAYTYLTLGVLDQALQASRDSLAIAERLAKGDPGNANWQHDLAIAFSSVGDVLVGQGKLDEALQAYRNSLAIAERLAKADPGNDNWQDDLSVFYITVGEVLVRQGQLGEALQAYRDSLAIAERLAKAEPGNAGLQRGLAIAFSGVGDVLVRQGKLDEALQAYRNTLAIAERLERADPGDVGRLRDLSVVHEKIGDVLAGQGKLGEALQAYRDSLAIRERLAKADPGNTLWQRDLLIVSTRVAGVLEEQGKRSEALQAYRDSLAIAQRLPNKSQGELAALSEKVRALEAPRDILATAERLAKADPGNADRQFGLSVAYILLGDMLAREGKRGEALQAYRESLAIAERLAKAAPGNVGWQRHLAFSYGKVGDVLKAQGRLGEALQADRDSLAVAERLAKADPGNAEWQRYLFVEYGKIGDVLLEQGKLGDALQAYRDSLAIAERLADPGNAEWQRDLSVAYNRVADVLVAQGKLGEALQAYREGLAIVERLARADPGKADWQRDLSVAYGRVGEVLVAQGKPGDALQAYRDGLAIAERLAKDYPGNAEWQRDLAVAYRKIGDALVAQGKPGDALQAYRDGLAIAERLAKDYPGNARWQRDLSFVYGRVGDVLVVQGQLFDALLAYRRSLAIRERLAKADPDNADWQRDLAISHAKLASILLGNVAEALIELRKGRDIIARLVALASGNAQWNNDLAWFDREIAKLEGGAQEAGRN